jgi:hypothetical protein
MSRHQQIERQARGFLQLIHLVGILHDILTLRVDNVTLAALALQYTTITNVVYSATAGGPPSIPQGGD